MQPNHTGEQKEVIIWLGKLVDHRTLCGYSISISYTIDPPTHCRAQNLPRARSRCSVSGTSRVHPPPADRPTGGNGWVRVRDASVSSNSIVWGASGTRPRPLLPGQGKGGEGVPAVLLSDPPSLLPKCGKNTATDCWEHIVRGLLQLSLVQAKGGERRLAWHGASSGRTKGAAGRGTAGPQCLF
eukprot:gene12498-biopygen12484